MGDFIEVFVQAFALEICAKKKLAIPLRSQDWGFDYINIASTQRSY
jgi:hypothetical protein